MTNPFWIAALAAALSLPAAYAADSPPAQQQASKAAVNDFGKLSHDGVLAFRDVALARLDIFNGQTAKAKTEIDRARTEIKRARSEDVVFTNAESELTVPAGRTQPGNAQRDTNPVSWIPVDGSLLLDENYQATPDKQAGLAKANSQLQAGQSKQALDTLKLADIDVTVVQQVAPLDKTATGIDQAATLMDQKHYYEANQALGQVQDGLRYDSTSYVAAPARTATNATGK